MKHPVHSSARGVRHQHRPNVTLAAQSVGVADAKDDPRQLIGLDYETWLPFAAKVFDISPNIDDYVLVATPICPSDIPNRNGIGFPLNELTKFMPPPISQMAYKAWKRTPVHREHANEVHKDAYGIVFDASLHRVEGYGQGKLWKVMGLAGIDKKKYPKMAQRILDNEVNTYSMGALVETFTCSFCGQPYTPSIEADENPEELMAMGIKPRTRRVPAKHCQHLSDTDLDWNPVRDFDGSEHVAFRNAHGIGPIELSIVESPAWTTALSDHILTR